MKPMIAGSSPADNARGGAGKVTPRPPLFYKEEAVKEVNKESFDDAKDRYKEKLTDLNLAEKTVKNLKRELEDLEDEIAGE